MLTMAQARDLDGVTPVSMFRITMDLCSLENGVAPCTATSPCRFTWLTCQDTAHYDQSSRVLKFTNRGAICVAGALPLLQSPVQFGATEILADEFKTERGRLVFTLEEDDADPVSDPEKSTTQTDTGRYLANMVARSPNLVYRKAELVEGFAEVDPDDWEVVWAGYVEDVEFNDNGGVDIACQDRLWFVAEAEAPGPVNDTNTVQDDPLTSGATTLTVVDKDEFPDASADEPQVVKVKDEYMIYTGKGAGTTQTLTGLTRGAFGTTAAAHDQGSEIINVLAYLQDDGASIATCTGIEAEVILLDLLCKRAGIDPEFVATYDPSVLLAEDLDTSETGVDVDDASVLPDTGVFKVGAEWIYWGGKSGNTLTPCKRGMFGSTAAAHSTSDPIYLPTLAREIQLHRPGTKWGCVFESETPIEELVMALARSIYFDVWVNEDGLIECKEQAPPPPTESIPTITHEDMLHRSHKYRRNEESRCTAVIVRYKASVPDPAESKESYLGRAFYVGAEEEAAVLYGRRKIKEVFAPFCRTTSDGVWLAERVMNRYRSGCPYVEYAVSFFNSQTFTGELVYITIPERVDVDGAPIERLYQAVRRERKEDEWWFRVLDTGYGDDRYGLIGPAMAKLDANINDSVETVDLDLSATDLTHDDFRSTGDIAIDGEQISYTAKTDLGGDVTRLSGCTRAAGGTAAAAHTAGADVQMLWSAGSDTFRRLYACFCDSNNELETGVAGFRFA